MSDQDEDLELQALRRQLDDAFETMRPRPGFEDELWLRMQTRRPFFARARDAVAALVQGIRAVPAVPMAGIAAIVIVVIGVGIFAYSGAGHFGGATSSTAGGELSQPANQQITPGSFGKVPTPVFGPGAKGNTGTAPAFSQTPSNEYMGPAQLTWTGHFDLTVSSAPVFKYREPSTNTADQFASALGAVLHGRPAGLLGSYEASDYTLQIRGTVQSPPQSPAYFIFSSPTMPALDAAGAGPPDLANLFLAQHGLVPQWNYTVATETAGDVVKVHYQRQFDAPGYGTAFLIGAQAQRYGMEVDLSGARVAQVSGLLPVSLEVATYPIITSDAAVRAAIATGTPVPVTTTPAPSVQLDRAELAYVLVPAGDHSFYEPVFLFSGTFQLNGTTYIKHVLVPAVDPSQRIP